MTTPDLKVLPASFNDVPHESRAERLRRRNAALSRWLQSTLLIALGFTWGGITACSMAFEDFETKIQAGALIVAMGFAFCCFRDACMLAWLNSYRGLLLTAHVAAAIGSGFVFNVISESILRYAALLPAFSILLSIVQGGFGMVEKVRLGLTSAGVVFVVFHLFMLDYQSIMDPLYRISVFLNPNSTAFIAAMTGLSAVGFAFRAKTHKWAKAFWLGVAMCCAVLLFGTKSRTAVIALAAGTLAFSWIRFRTTWARLGTIGVIVLCLAYAVQHRETITDAMSLDEKERSIETGTGRYDIWSFLLTTVIPQNPWLGIGPGQHSEVVLSATGSTNAHNGFLTSLAETGILGTLPLVLLTLCSFYTVWRRRNLMNHAWVAALFVAGVVESLGESVFFSIGNPASLLFMLSVATLALPVAPEFAEEPVTDSPPVPVEPPKLILHVSS